MRMLLVATGSPYTKQALLFGAQLARRADEPPTLLYVRKRPAAASQVASNLARARAHLAPGIPNVHTLARFGRPADQIIFAAEEERSDLIVVGERIRPGARIRRLFGSASRTVAEQAPCSVLVVKGKSRHIRRVLLCDSGARSPSLFDRFTSRLVHLLDGGEAITVLHVMSQMSAGPGVSGDQLRADAEELIAEHAPEGQLLEQGLQILEQAHLNAQAKVRHGLVVDEILAEARNGDHDLVVIGAHPEQGWRHFLLDDVAHRLLIRLDRPVLVVR